MTDYETDYETGDELMFFPADYPVPKTLILSRPTCENFVIALEAYVASRTQHFQLRRGIDLSTYRRPPESNSRWLYWVVVSANVLDDPHPDYAQNPPPKDGHALYGFEVVPVNAADSPGCLVTIRADPGLPECFDDLLQAIANAWPEAEEQLREQGALPSDKEGARGEISSGDVPTHPWERIPDRGWRREAVKLWWEGYTVPQIASKVDRAEKTVRNKLSDLRNSLGEEVVPTAEQLRKQGQR